MEAREIIEFIGNAEKKTPVKVYVKEKEPVDFAGCQVFGNGDKIVFCEDRLHHSPVAEEIGRAHV